MTNYKDNNAGSAPDEYAPDIPTINVETGIETYNNRITTTKDLLINDILVKLGYPLVTVELTESQLDICISNALHTYTKYATFPDRYLMVDLHTYEENQGINLKKLNISVVKDIELLPPMYMGMSTSELSFGMAGQISQMGSWHHFSFVSLQLMHEFREMARRMLWPKPDWTFNNVTGQLLMYPSPQNYMYGGRHKYMSTGNQRSKHCKVPSVFTVEIEPPLEELYSTDAVKQLTFGYAKMLLGTIRSKFQNVSLPGGAVVSGEVFRTEGQAAVTEAINEIRKTESIGNMFIIA